MDRYFQNPRLTARFLKNRHPERSMNANMNILIQTLAWVLLVIGLLSGVAAVIMVGEILFGETGYSFLLIFLPLLCVAAIRISRRYFQQRNYQCARAVAAMYAFFAWLLIRAVTRPPDLDSIHFFSVIAPLVCGVAVYYLLMLGIRRSFQLSCEQNKTL